MQREREQNGQRRTEEIEARTELHSAVALINCTVVACLRAIIYESTIWIYSNKVAKNATRQLSWIQIQLKVFPSSAVWWVSSSSNTIRRGRKFEYVQYRDKLLAPR